jgi:hypothetical protein
MAILELFVWNMVKKIRDLNKQLLMLGDKIFLDEIYMQKVNLVRSSKSTSNFFLVRS